MGLTSLMNDALAKLDVNKPWFVRARDIVWGWIQNNVQFVIHWKDSSASGDVVWNAVDLRTFAMIDTDGDGVLDAPAGPRANKITTSTGNLGYGLGLDHLGLFGKLETWGWLDPLNDVTMVRIILPRRVLALVQLNGELSTVNDDHISYVLVYSNYEIKPAYRGANWDTYTPGDVWNYSRELLWLSNNATPSLSHTYASHETLVVTDSLNFIVNGRFKFNFRIVPIAELENVYDVEFA